MRLRTRALLIVLLVAGCQSPPPAPAPTLRPPSPSPSGPVVTPPGTPAQRAAALAGSLADEDLVGQVLMPYAYGSSATDVTPGNRQGNQRLAGVDTPAQMVARYRLGGLILVGFTADDPTSANQGTTNVDSAQQVRGLTSGLQAAHAQLAAGSAPMLIGTDQEFGVVTRIKTGVTALPSAMGAGAAGDPRLTEAAWGVAGGELAALGVNVDFAPVADVLGSAASTVIGSRSYGSDPAQVSAQVAAAVRGLQGSGVAATLKHFPGHGHTAGDSHEALPTLGQDRAGLAKGDLPPFVAGVGAGAKLVMSGHLDVQAIDPGMPATFSRKVLTDLLRGELGFKGVVITDGMNMAPAKRWPAGEAAVRALNAGNDIILMPDKLPEAYNGLLAGLKSGSLTKARLVEAVTRVLTLKFELAERPTPDMSTVGNAANRAAAARLATAAVTQLRGACGTALVRGPVQVTAASGRDTARGWLVDALREAGVQVVGSGGQVVHLVGYGDGTTDLRKGATVTVAMDTPYLLGESDSKVLLATYSSGQASMAGLAAVLAGKAPAIGRSPVAVPGLPRTSCAAAAG